MNPEALWRATLHDLNNAFGGLRGILDLNPDPMRPLRERDRQRLEAVVAEGLHLVALARGMVLGRVDGDQPLEAKAFQEALEARLAPMISLHRCPVTLAIKGGPWPHPGLVTFCASVSRQLLPMVAPGPLFLDLEGREDVLVLTWSPVEAIPESLLPGEDRHRDLPAHHALAYLEARSGALELAQGGLRVTLPRR